MNCLNWIGQAYRLENSHKEIALHTYKGATRILTHSKLRKILCKDNCSLDAMFIELWMRNIEHHEHAEFLSKLTTARIAFNYANLTLGIGGRFKELALEVNESTHLIDEIELQAISDSLNFVLTDTGTDDSRFATH